MTRFHEQRKAHGYSQSELAKMLFVNQTAVSQWDRGVTTPSPPILLKLSSLYGVSVDYLLGGPSQPPDPAKKEERPNRNIIKIEGRDGTFIERELTDEQISLIRCMLDQMRPFERRNAIDIDAEVASYRAELEDQQKKGDESSVSDGSAAKRA